MSTTLAVLCPLRSPYNYPAHCKSVLSIAVQAAVVMSYLHFETAAAFVLSPLGPPNPKGGPQDQLGSKSETLINSV